MKMQRRGAAAAIDSSHGIDLAPMLDFVLNLLIFFIITAIFIKEVGIEVYRPSQLPPPQSDQAKHVNIQILESGEVFFDGRLVDMRAIRANIENEKAQHESLGITIIADDAASTGLVVGVADQVRQGGTDNITFTTSQ